MCEGDNSKDEDEDEGMEGEGVDVDVESGETEDKDLPEPWGCLARSVYPPLINYACLLDAEFQLNKKPLDDVMEPPKRLDALLDAAEGEKLERMEGYNARGTGGCFGGCSGRGRRLVVRMRMRRKKRRASMGAVA